MQNSSDWKLVHIATYHYCRNVGRQKNQSKRWFRSWFCVLMLWIALETLATISWVGSLVMGWDSLILPRQPKVVREIGGDWHVNEFVGNFCCHPFEGYDHKSPKVNHSSSCGDTKIMVKHAPRVTPFHHLWSFENICQETHQERHDLGWKIIYPCSPNKTGKIWN